MCRGHLTSDKASLVDELKRTIRDVNNFPKPGIVFKDVTPVLLVDDVLATGGTANAAAQLVGGTGAAVAGFSFLIELEFLKGRQRLQGRRVEALLHYA